MSSADLHRYGNKLRRYLMALKEVSDALKSSTVREREVDVFLTSLLKILSEAFVSEIAFVADGEGELLFTFPESNPLNDKRLSFLTSAGQELWKEVLLEFAG